MGDVGSLDAGGWLWVCGRNSQRVVTPQGTLFTIPCEAIFNTHARVARTALVGLGAQGAARPVVCVELKDGAQGNGIEAELLELAASQPHTREIRTFLVYRGSFPVDVRHNAKIFREK